MTDNPATRAAEPRPSPKLFSAALRGILCITVSSCGSDDPGSNGGDVNGKKILSSRVDESITLASFTAECDEHMGVVETHATCGGASSCTGFSYDSDTHVFTEHSCRGANTCPGFSCVLEERAS